MQDDGDRVQAEGFNWGFNGNLVASGIKATCRQQLGNITRGNRAVKLAGIAGLANDDKLLAFELGVNGFGFGAAL